MKNTINRYLNILMFGSLFLLSGSCEKKFLDKQNDASLVIPETLEDLQALLNNASIMNGSNTGSGMPVPSLGEAASNDFYYEDARYASRSEVNRDLYIWKKTYTDDWSTVVQWSMPYRTILNANVALDYQKNIERTNINAALWDNVKGSALFFRAFMFYHLSQVYAPPYGPDAKSQLGIPLRLEADISQPFERKSLHDTYLLMLNDVKEAVDLLPLLPKYKTSPSRAAAYALLARIYLAMASYEEAGQYAEKSLAVADSLMDYQLLNASAEFPIPLLNKEVLFYANAGINDIISLGIVSPELLALYENGDLRKMLYYNAQGNFRGGYNGMDVMFGGLTTSDMILIAAESAARQEKETIALSYINRLRKHRFSEADYREIGIGETDLLKFVLEERRREMVLRGSTWSDLRRLNLEERFKRTLRREVQGQVYTLEPGDSRYTFLIPLETIVASGTPQNNR